MGVKVLSLFDGMACGMLAMQKAGIDVAEYIAYEVDKYAIQTATHNFPMIKECGDVFKADFAQHKDIDYLVGGSPCTYWSCAQTHNRETEASGLGWELFSQYVRAVQEVKPKYFIYENNKSMSNAIRESITKAFGFEPVCINSALVSAQNRQRLYWVGKRNADGTYSQVEVKQPGDRGILLKDILESNGDYQETYELTHSCNYNVADGGTLRVAYTDASESQGYRVYSPENKSVALRAQGNGRGAELVAAPITVKTTRDGKGQCLRATCYKDGIRNMIANTVDRRTCVAEPVGVTRDGKAYCMTAGYSNGSGENIGNYAAHTLKKGCKSMVAVPVDYVFVDCNVRNNAHIAVNENAIRGVQNKNGNSCAENFYEFTDRKANTLTTAHVPKIVDDVGKYAGYAGPCEWDANGNPTKAVSSTDGKVYTVYAVKDGQITIKGEKYKIKLADGFYIIRKLTVTECKRLQTVPEWYEFPVSTSQAYKLLGNGWTVDVIAHLLQATLN